MGIAKSGANILYPHFATLMRGYLLSPNPLSVNRQGSAKRMSEIATQGFKLVRTSPGLGLVALGFTTIYFVVGLRGGSEPTTVTYFAVGFSFLVTLAGITLLFRDLSR